MQENLSIDLLASDHPDHARVADYLQAFAARDLARCMSFYGDAAGGQATIVRRSPA